MRILIVVTHLLGVGHLSRAAALGRAFAQAGHTVRLISGGRPAPAIEMAGMEVVQLPSLHVLGTDFRTLYGPDGSLADAAYLAGRQAQLLAAAVDFGADAAVVELFPFGRRQLSAEFLALVAALKKPPYATALFSSIRDVLTPPSTPEKTAQSHGWLGLFDGVLVHADPGIMPLEESWPVDDAVRRRLAYTGYVSQVRPVPGQPRAGVIVSGGGSATALPLMRAALAIAAGDGRAWRILVGHALPEVDFAALKASAPGNAIVERARPDFPALLAGAECSISQFGYNTALDLAASGTPAVVVPYDEGKEVEQTIRARRFAALGLIEHLPAAALTAEALGAAMARAVQRGVVRTGLDLNGASRTVALVTAGAASRQGEVAAWRRLDAALGRAAAAGQSARLWWRDDDATDTGGDLDRLLGLRAAMAVPLALAVIPAAATQRLAARLAGEAGVRTLVHGIAHSNGAGAGARKQELLAADAATLAGLTQALGRMKALFGAAALPVLVPPWNRISPDVVAALPQLGFAGWSGFDDRMPSDGAGGRGAEGLAAVRAVPTHLDVIDWKAGGGLAPVAPMLERLARLIEMQRQDDPPLGILTHHRAHDPWVWTFLERLFGRLCSHGGGHFLAAEAAFGLTSPAPEGRQAP